MILTREIEILITEKNIDYFENLGYDTFNGDKIMIPVELLKSGSNKKILCKCDKCGLEKEIVFKNYIRYNNDWGVYFCRKCSEHKRKKTLKENRGVEYPIQSKEINNKIKNTIKEKYGVENIRNIKKDKS
jgi:hypothetical protein|tara:strand:- start:188 stop:577 length:390 start_codon:yes stop_codon:yes gene_type:complete